MFDDLRQQAEESTFEDEFEEDEFSARELQLPQRHFLGMTPLQRFVIAVMLLIMTCVLGAFLLLVTEKIIPPILF